MTLTEIRTVLRDVGPEAYLKVDQIPAEQELGSELAILLPDSED